MVLFNPIAVFPVFFGGSWDQEREECSPRIDYRLVALLCQQHIVCRKCVQTYALLFMKTHSKFGRSIPHATCRDDDTKSFLTGRAKSCNILDSRTDKDNMIAMNDMSERKRASALVVVLVVVSHTHRPTPP